MPAAVVEAWKAAATAAVAGSFHAQQADGCAAATEPDSAPDQDRTDGPAEMRSSLVHLAGADAPAPPERAAKQEAGVNIVRFRQAAARVLLQQATADWMRKRGIPPPPPPLSALQRAEIAECFHLLDADGSGEGEGGGSGLRLLARQWAVGRGQGAAH